jgi:uncharacterized protein YneF (UPF0154 family)
MITGFEEITKDLSGLEKSQVAQLVKLLHTAKGKKCALSNKQLQFMMLQYNHDVSEIRIRKMINFIRTKGLIINLLANSRGYWISTNNDEVLQYYKSLTERIEAIAEVRDHLQPIIQ